MSCDPFPVDWSVCGAAPTATPVQLETALGAATSILRGRTGNRLGLCTVTDRYRLPARFGLCPGPYKDRSGTWRNSYGTGSCCVLRLAEQPVFSVTAVTLDGVALSASSWRLEQGTLRSRNGCWPAVADCDDPAIAVTYQWGIPLRPALYDLTIPASPVLLRAADPLYHLAAAATAEVAREIVEGLCGRTCKLPSRAVTVTRNGVSVAMSSTDELADRGFLGLPMADELIRATNPRGLISRSRVFSPDMARRA